jgi:Mitochondrial ribosomal subunit protein
MLRQIVSRALVRCCANCLARRGHAQLETGAARSSRIFRQGISKRAAPAGAARYLSSKPPPPPCDDEELNFEDDEFTSILALDPKEAERATAAALAPKDVVEELSGAPHDMTPAQADALVRSMVSAAARSADPGTAALAAPPPLTVDDLNVLRHARIETNHIVSVGGERRIERKAVGRVDLKALGLGRLAVAAVEEIAGPRCRDGMLRIVGDRYRSSEENVAWVASQLGKVVREAKNAVGDDVNDTVLETWDEVLGAARSAVEDDTPEVRTMVEMRLSGKGTVSHSAGAVEAEVPNPAPKKLATVGTGTE